MRLFLVLQLFETGLGIWGVRESKSNIKNISEMQFDFRFIQKVP